MEPTNCPRPSQEPEYLAFILFLIQGRCLIQALTCPNSIELKILRSLWMASTLKGRKDYRNILSTSCSIIKIICKIKAIKKPGGGSITSLYVLILCFIWLKLLRPLWPKTISFRRHKRNKAQGSSNWTRRKRGNWLNHVKISNPGMRRITQT